MSEWTHFDFDSGANPYIAMTKEKREEVMNNCKSLGFEVEEIRPHMFLVHDGRTRRY